MTQEEKNLKAAQIWLLVSSLNTVRFAIAELEPHKMGQHYKMKYMILKNNIDNFLRSMKRNTPEADRQLLDTLSFDSVGAVAEAIAMILQVHPDQQEWLLDEIKKLTFHSVNRQALNSK